MVEKVISRTLSIPDNKVEEAKKDMRAILNPASHSFNDGWAAKAFQEKWGMSINEMGELIGKPVWSGRYPLKQRGKTS